MQRAQLTAAERALLDLLIGLSRRHGLCYAGERFMADALHCTDRWIRTLLARLHEKGHLAITRRPGRKHLIKVLRADPLTPSRGLRIGPDKLTPRNDRSGVPRNDRSTPGRNDRSALTSKRPLTPIPLPDPDEAPLFDKRPRRFNPLRPFHRGDNRAPEVRLANAVREGTVLYMQIGRRQRVVQRVTYSPSQVFVHLLSEDGSAVEIHTLSLLQIGSTWFGR